MNFAFSGQMSQRTHLLMTTGVYFCSTAFLMQFPRYVLQLGGDAQDAGWMVALGLLPTLLFAGLVGDWNRRRGGRIPALVGGGIVIASHLLMLFVHHIDAALYGVRLLYALGHAILFVTLFTQAALISDELTERAKTIGWLAVTMQLGNAAGGAVGEWLFLAGMAPFWLGCAGLAALATGLCVLFPHGAAATASAASEAMPSVSGSGSRGLPPEVWAVAAIGLAFASVTQFIPPFIAQQGQDGHLEAPFAAAWFITPALLVVAAVRLIGGHYAARLLTPGTLRACHGLLLLTILALPWLHSRNEALALAVAFGLGYGWLYPALNALAFKHAAPETHGRVAGWVTNAFEIGFRLGTLGLGTMIVHWGYRNMFLGLGAIYLLVLGVGWIARRRQSALLLALPAGGCHR